MVKRELMNERPHPKMSGLIQVCRLSCGMVVKSVCGVVFKREQERVCGERCLLGN
jgi:hypothetical protein